MKTLVHFITLLLVLLFVYTAFSKWFDFETFVGQMHNQPLPLWFTSVLVWMVPLVETGIAGLLITERYRTQGLLLSFLLLMVFTLYVGLILANTFPYVPCSCAGIFQGMSWGTHLVVNSVLAVAALLGYLLSLRSRHCERSEAIC